MIISYTVYIWERSKMSATKFLYRINEHRDAVKALAWCPYQSNELASGRGTEDGCIQIWNFQKGTYFSRDTGAQICGLEWNMHHKEILNGHGLTNSGNENKLCVWKYPFVTKVGELKQQSSRVPELSQSPDGLTGVSWGG